MQIKSRLQSLKQKKWFGWLAQILVIVVVYWLIQAYQTRDAPKGIAPDFSGVLINGEPFHLRAENKPIMVHFWATWCSICRLEQGSIDSVAKDYRVIGVASQSGTADEVKTHVQKTGITVPVFVDESGEIARAYGVKAFPTSFVLAEDGSISDVEVGFTTEFGIRWRLWWAGVFG